jgi:hypothetical protein
MARPKKNAQAASSARASTSSARLPGTQTVEVTIEGVSPLLMHRFSEEAENPEAARAVHVDRGSPREQAERAAYRMPSDDPSDPGQLYFPGTAIGRLLREAGSAHKQRGSRKSMKYVLPAAVIMLDDAMLLHDPENNREPLYDFELDSRPVVIPATKGRIMRHRPRVLEWMVQFTLEVDTTLVSIDFVHQLLQEGGRRIGIGDFRPERGGSFGRFLMSNWSPARASD